MITRKLFKKSLSDNLMTVSFHADEVICPFTKSYFLSNYFGCWVAGSDYFGSMCPCLLTRVYLEDNTRGRYCRDSFLSWQLAARFMSLADYDRSGLKICFEYDSYIRLAERLVFVPY
jgi:hypothetical protein